MVKNEFKVTDMGIKPNAKLSSMGRNVFRLDLVKYLQNNFAKNMDK